MRWAILAHPALGRVEVIASSRKLLFCFGVSEKKSGGGDGIHCSHSGRNLSFASLIQGKPSVCAKIPSWYFCRTHEKVPVTSSFPPLTFSIYFKTAQGLLSEPGWRERKVQDARSELLS
jgi:hypothetical protein